MIAATTAFTALPSTSFTTTFAPKRPYWRAYARPRPDPAPVTITVLPSNRTSGDACAFDGALEDSAILACRNMMSPYS